MYEIWIKNGDTKELLHELDTNSFRRVRSCKFTEEISQIPSAVFEVFPQNPAYEHLHELTTLIEIKNTLTGEVEFEGRLLQKPMDAVDSNGIVGKRYTCEGLLAYLCDSRQMYQPYDNCPPSVFLETLLDIHNNRFPDKEIFLAQCDISTVRHKTTAYRTTLDEIKENLTSRLGGEISVKRNSNGKLVLSYLSNGSGEKKNTVVELGKNIVEINHSTDATNVISRLIPLGAQLNDTTAERLTLNGYFDDPEQFWIEDSNAMLEYGPIEGTVEFDDVTTKDYLAQVAEEYLAENNRVRHSYKAQVLDLSTIGKDIDAFRVGNTYRFRCSLIGLDDDLRIIKRTVDVYEPYKPVIEIGDKTQKLTDIQTNVARLIEYTIPQQKYDILDSARRTATALIHNATTGHLVYRPGEMLIMDTPDIETATKVWRFNSGGIGYSNTGYNGTYGLAMTMDGSIVADFIMTGILRSLQIINGDNGQFSVDVDGNCVANAFSSNNAVITGGSLAVSGTTGTIRIYGGMIALDNADGNRILEIYGNGTFRAWSATAGNWFTDSFEGIERALIDLYDKTSAQGNRIYALEQAVFK